MGDEPSTANLFGQMSLFQGLSEEQLAQIAERVPTLVLSRDELVYEQGGEADTFFVILSGRVQLSRVTRQAELSFGVLEENDYFGQEALSPDQLRQTTAKAVTDVVLAAFDSDHLKELFEQYPTLKKRVKIIEDTFAFRIKLSLPWLGPRETVYYIGRRHVMYLLPRLILPGLLFFLLLPLWIFLYTSLHLVSFLYLLIATIVIVAGWTAWVIYDWSNDHSIITNRRALFQEKIALIYDSRQEVPLDAILADDVTTGQIGRWLDYGNLIIRTYTGSITFPGIPMPDEVKILLDNRKQRANVRAQRNKRRAIRNTIRQHIGVNEEETAETFPEESVKPTIHTGTLPNALSDLFMLRTEVNGVITYRTHWFILLSKTFFPTLLLFATLTLLIARLVNAFNFLSIPSTLLLCFLLFLIFGTWELYRYVDWRNDRYIITDKELIDVYKRPLGVEQKRTAPLENILSIDYERPNLIHLILNFGTVYIRIGEASLTFNNVFNPDDVQREIFERFLNKKLQKQQQSDENEQRRLAEWLEIYHEETSGLAQDEENLDDDEEETE